MMRSGYTVTAIGGVNRIDIADPAGHIIPHLGAKLLPELRIYPISLNVVWRAIMQVVVS
jgi:hypothetical protein